MPYEALLHCERRRVIALCHKKSLKIPKGQSEEQTTQWPK